MKNELNELEYFNKKINIEFQNDISKQEIEKYNEINKKFQDKILETNAISNIIYFLFKNNINKFIKLLNMQNINNTRIILTGQAIADLIYYYIKEDIHSETDSDFSRMINILKNNINDIDIFVLAYKNELKDSTKTDDETSYNSEEKSYRILKESKITTNVYYQDFFTKINFIHVYNNLLDIDNKTSNSLQDFLYLSLISQFDINSVQVGVIIDIKELKKMLQGKLKEEIFTAKLLYTRNYLAMFDTAKKSDENYTEIKQVKTNLNIKSVKSIERFIKKSTRRFYENKFDMLYPLKVFLILEELGNIIKKTGLNYINFYLIEEYLKTRNEIIKLFFDNYKILKEHFYVGMKDQIDEEDKKFINFIEQYRYQDGFVGYYIPAEIKFYLDKENENFNNKIKYLLNEFLEIKDYRNIEETINEYNFINLANKILKLMEIKNSNKLVELKEQLKKENLNYKLAFLNFIVYEEEILNEPISKLIKFFKYIDEYYYTEAYNLLLNNLPNKIEFYNTILELDNYLTDEEKINNLLEFKNIKKFLNQNNKEEIKKLIKTKLKFYVASLEDYKTIIYIIYLITYSNLELNNKKDNNNMYSFIKNKYLNSYYQNICVNIAKTFYFPKKEKLKNKNIIIKNEQFILEEIIDNLKLEYLVGNNNNFYIYKEAINDLELFIFEITLLNNNKKFLIKIFLNNEGRYTFEKDIDVDDFIPNSRIYIMEDFKLKNIEYNKINSEDRELLDQAIETILKRLNNKYNILSI